MGFLYPTSATFWTHATPGTYPVLDVTLDHNIRGNDLYQNTFTTLKFVKYPNFVKFSSPDRGHLAWTRNWRKTRDLKVRKKTGCCGWIWHFYKILISGWKSFLVSGRWANLGFPGEPGQVWFKAVLYKNENYQFQCGGFGYHLLKRIIARFIFLCYEQQRLNCTGTKWVKSRKN